MKETGIIMSGNHPKLILDGIKTMTRRVVKPEWKKLIHDWDNAFVTSESYKLHVPVRHPEEPDFSDHRVTRIYCPYGQVGDRLWVRETWRLEMHSGCFDVAYKDTVWKKDAGSNPYMTQYRHLRDRTWIWRPSIFMPRWASRITLEITELRAERIRQITAQDVVAEGLLAIDENFPPLWDSLNAKRGYGWEANPWVWVIGFQKTSN